MNDHRRTRRRIFGWGGALIFSLLVWAAVFRLAGGLIANEARCVADGDGAAETATCAARGGW